MHAGLVNACWFCEQRWACRSELAEFSLQGNSRFIDAKDAPAHY
jgi:hypothetical protein